MDYLGRSGAPCPEELWSAIDNAVVSSAKNALAARRFIPFTGPAGASAQFAKIDRFNKSEEFDEWYVKTTNRQVVEIPQLYSDFWLNWRDIEASGTMPDLSGAMFAAQKLARHEDEMVFYGIPALGVEGLATVKGSSSIKRKDWSQGENAFADVAAGIETLAKNGRIGRRALTVSPDLAIQLQRIQPGTGQLESKRIKKLVGSGIIVSPVLKSGTALLACAEPFCMDLLVGQDIRTAYLESVDLNHHFRVLETALPRIKCPDAIVILK